MLSDWGEENTDLLLKHLYGKDYLYNRIHPDYKTYNVVKECADIGGLFNPPKTGKEVLDKVTSIRNNLIQIKKSVEKCNADFNFPSNFHKYYFIYVSLFGELPKNFAKLIKTENVLNDNEVNTENTQDVFKTNNKRIKIENIFIDKFNIDFKANDYEHQNSSPKIKGNHDITIRVENENILVKGELLLTIINFIRDKSFLWNLNDPMYSNAVFKKQVLEDFSKSLNPPIAANLVQNRIGYLRKKFFKALNSNNKSNWHLFENCKFFVTSVKKDETINYPNEEKIQNESAVYRIIKFIKDKPYLYNRKHPKYYDLEFKNNILIDFGQTFSPPLSFRALKKRITYLRLKFLEYLKKPKERSCWRWFNQCDFFLSEQSKTFTNNHHKKMLKGKSVKEPLNKKEETLKICVNKETSILEEKNNKTFYSKKILFERQSAKPAVEIGIQCDLFKEIFEDKLKTRQLKECPCFEDFMKIIQYFKPIDTNQEMQEAVEHFDSKVFLAEDNKNYEYEHQQMLSKSIHETFIKKEEKDGYTTDSSDYGLAEIPFPEKPKTSTKKTIDKYPCDKCPKKFNTHKLLDKHFTHFHAQCSLLCSKCGKINSSFRKMQMHENTCNPDENRFCYECKQVFKSKIIYYDHFNLVHDRKNPYICCCGRSFMKYTKLVLHLNTFHCGSIDTCTLPDYISKEFLDTFIESKCNVDNQNTEDDNIKKKLKFWCIMCKNNFYNNRSYMAHFDRTFHLNAEKQWLEKFNIEEPFECEICERNKSVFGHISELVKHRHKYHHKCTLASYFEKFEYADDGEEILITEPTNYSSINSLCHICKYIFCMGDFQKHFESFEHKNLEKKWLEKLNLSNFECCSTKFAKLLDLLKHKHSKHGEWPINRLLKSIEGEADEEIPEYLTDRINTKLIYKCSICNYYSCYKSSFIIHMLHHIPEKYIECSCGDKFITSVKLHVHQRRKGCSRNGCKIPRFVLQIDSAINSNLVGTY